MASRETRYSSGPLRFEPLALYLAVLLVTAGSLLAFGNTGDVLDKLTIASAAIGSIIGIAFWFFKRCSLLLSSEGLKLEGMPLLGGRNSEPTKLFRWNQIVGVDEGRRFGARIPRLKLFGGETFDLYAVSKFGESSPGQRDPVTLVISLIQDNLNRKGALSQQPPPPKIA